jgi:hypothetical protein
LIYNLFVEAKFRVIWKNVKFLPFNQTTLQNI